MRPAAVGEIGQLIVTGAVRNESLHAGRNRAVLNLRMSRSTTKWSNRIPDRGIINPVQCVQGDPDSKACSDPRQPGIESESSNQVRCMRIPNQVAALVASLGQKLPHSLEKKANVFVSQCGVSMHLTISATAAGTARSAATIADITMRDNANNELGLPSRGRLGKPNYPNRPTAQRSGAAELDRG
jgi:hypothetical protein